MTTPTLCAGQSTSRLSTGARWATAVLTGVVFVCGMVMTHRIVAIDDAFISYRYAANLVQSGQLVYNIGERVEGATNLLWILELAALNWATDLPIETLGIGTDLVLAGFAVARCQMLLRWLGLSFWDSCLVVTATFGLADVFLALTNGLEAALYAAVLSEALLAAYLKRPVVLGLLIGLLYMTRPEGAVMGAILLICLLPFSSIGQTLFRAATPALAIIGVTTIWRFIHFGALLPNSIIDKSFPLVMLPIVVWTVSLPYLKSFMASDPTLGITFMVAGCLAALSSTGRTPNVGRDPSSLLVSTSLILLISLLIAARNGGDWMPHFRLLTQYAPCYCVALGLITCRWLARPRPVLAALTAIALWPTFHCLSTKTCCTINIQTASSTGVFADAARLLAPILKKTDIVSAEAAGLLPYRLLSTRIHDPLGLMDSYIARHGTPTIPYGKMDIRYTFEDIRPTFMVWHWAGHVSQASSAARSRYAAFCFAKCDQRDAAAIVLVRRDRLDAAVEDAFKTWTPWSLIDGAPAQPANEDRR